MLIAYQTTNNYKRIVRQMVYRHRLNTTVLIAYLFFLMKR